MRQLFAIACSCAFAFACTAVLTVGTASAQESVQNKTVIEQPQPEELGLEAVGPSALVLQTGNSFDNLAVVGQSNPVAEALVDQVGLNHTAIVRQDLIVDGIYSPEFFPDEASFPEDAFFPDDAFFPEDAFFPAQSEVTIQQFGTQQNADVYQLGGPHDANIFQLEAVNRVGLVQSGEPEASGTLHGATIRQTGLDNLVAGVKTSEGGGVRSQSVASNRRAGQYGSKASRLRVAQTGQVNRLGIQQAGGTIAGVSQTEEGLVANSEGYAKQQGRGGTATVVQMPDRSAFVGETLSPEETFVGLHQEGRQSTAHIRQYGDAIGSKALVWQNGRNEALIDQGASNARAEVIQFTP